MTTSQRSRQTSFMNGSTVVPYGASLEDFLVSPFPLPGSKEAREMTVISGLKCLALSEDFGRRLWWERTLLASSVWRSTMCLLTWRPKVTPAGRSYYQLAVSAPHIDATEYGLWPTVTQGSAHERLTKYAQGGTPLTMAVHLYPTPNAAKAGNDLTLTCSGDGRQTPNKLGWAVAQRMWMTPKARDADFGTPSTSGRSREMSTHLGTQVAAVEGLLPTPQVSVGRNNTANRKPGSKHSPGETIYDLAYRAGGGTLKLNPDWVSRMMGFPDGWIGGVPYTPPRVRIQSATISRFADGEHYISWPTGYASTRPLRRKFRLPQRMTRAG